MGQTRSRVQSGVSGAGNDDTSENMDLDVTLMFPFLQDEDAVLYVKCSQVMIILRGLPGSGKSYVARRIKEKYGQNCVVCSVDDYFKQGTHYRFEPTKLHEAEDFCQQVAAEACNSGKHVVVIDNTNARLREISFYTRLSHEMNYVELVEEPRTPWKFDAVILAEKNKCNLDEDEMNERLEQWEEISPIYFGWFLNVSDSLALVKIAEAYMDECNSIPEFSEQFKELMSFDGLNDLREYFNLPDQDRMLHCTTRFCRHLNDEQDEYMRRKSVQKNYGTMTSLSVVGFVITPQTFLARVKLSSEQLTVWGQDDFELPSSVQEARDVARSSSVSMTPASASQMQRLPVCITTLRPYVNHERRTAQYFRPTEGVGRRAHITLGCAKGVKPVQSGFDLMEVAEYERARTKGPTFDIGFAKVRRYGEAMWVIYPNKLYVIDALFAFYMSEAN